VVVLRVEVKEQFCNSLCGARFLYARLCAFQESLMGRNGIVVAEEAEGVWVVVGDDVEAAQTIACLVCCSIL